MDSCGLGVQCTFWQSPVLAEFIVLVGTLLWILGLVQERERALWYFRGVIPTFIGSSFAGVLGVGMLPEDKLTQFLDEEQVNFLAVMIALSAYTSTVLGRINKALKKPINTRGGDAAWTENEWRKVKLNQSWLWPGDVMLVVLSLLMMIRMILSNGKYSLCSLDLWIMGLFAASVAYLGIVHGRQWKYYFTDWTSTPPTA